MIQSKVLKGFRDSLPSQEIVKKQIISILEKTFSSYGFVPIDTPVLEYTEVLLGKGGGETDKQIFHFADNGGRDVALRFDLTVPFARFMALHYNELSIPFKRYHINKVWRGENPQKGRFREFYQCDFDIVGVDNAISDSEILMMMYSSLSSLHLKNVSIHINHRGLFNSFLAHHELSQHSVEILRIVDKLRKIGEEETITLLNEIIGDIQKAKSIIEFITPLEHEDPYVTIERLKNAAGNDVESSTRLLEIFESLKSAHMDSMIVIDPSITRGLDYYTGIVYETFLNDLPSIGSICSGGRYNDLASLYTKEKLPGVGSSIGLDRLLSALEELGSPFFEKNSSADVILFNTDSSQIHTLQKVARELRNEGIRVDVYVSNKKINAQFKYAEQNSIPYGLFVTDEGSYQMRNLDSRKDYHDKTINELAQIIKEGA